MRISDRGINFIKREEGEVLSGYLDSKGVPTIGIGHTGLVAGKPVTTEMKISHECSSILLGEDLVWVENTIRRHVKASLNQNQYDALCSFIFNVGETAFIKSTMLKMINKQEFQKAAAEFPKWKRSGRNPDILLPRRLRERELFLS